MDIVLEQTLLASSNVRSASIIAPTGMLRQFKLRKDVSLLLRPREMGELIKVANRASLSFHKFMPKLGELRHMYLDFENLHALVFLMPDLNALLVTLEKVEPDVPRIVAYVTRLLEDHDMIHAH